MSQDSGGGVGVGGGGGGPPNFVHSGSGRSKKVSAPANLQPHIVSSSCNMHAYIYVHEHAIFESVFSTLPFISLTPLL